MPSKDEKMKFSCRWLSLFCSLLLTCSMLVSCSLIDGFRREIQYALPKKSTMKQVAYFLAEYEGQTLRPQPEEVAQIALLPYAQALKQLTHQQSKNILMDAHAFLCP